MTVVRSIAMKNALPKPVLRTVPKQGVLTELKAVPTDAAARVPVVRHVIRMGMRRAVLMERTLAPTVAEEPEDAVQPIPATMLLLFPFPLTPLVQLITLPVLPSVLPGLVILDTEGQETLVLKIFLAVTVDIGLLSRTAEPAPPLLIKD